MHASWTVLSRVSTIVLTSDNIDFDLEFSLIKSLVCCSNRLGLHISKASSEFLKILSIVKRK